MAYHLCIHCGEGLPRPTPREALVARHQHCPHCDKDMEVPFDEGLEQLVEDHEERGRAGECSLSELVGEAADAARLREVFGTMSKRLARMEALLYETISWLEEARQNNEVSAYNAKQAARDPAVYAARVVVADEVLARIKGALNV